MQPLFISHLHMPIRTPPQSTNCFHYNHSMVEATAIAEHTHSHNITSLHPQHNITAATAQHTHSHNLHKMYTQAPHTGNQYLVGPRQ